MICPANFTNATLSPSSAKAVKTPPMIADVQVTFVRGRSLFMNTSPASWMKAGARKRQAALDSTSRPDQ